MRRNWLKAGIAVVAGIAANWLGSHGWTQEGTSTNFANQVDQRHLVRLQDQLRFGLRATQQAQFDFIDQVAVAVEQGRIPRAMVNLVYRWALQKNPKVPFPYFEIALRELARRRGVSFST